MSNQSLNGKLRTNPGFRRRIQPRWQPLNPARFRTTGTSLEKSRSPHIDISSITGAELTRLDWDQLLATLCNLYSRSGNRLVYQPHAFNIQAQAGKVTDVQASLYIRFQADQEQAGEWLDDLSPLNINADPHDWIAAKVLVIQALEDIVSESGWVGGPRQEKMTAAFDTLENLLKRLGEDYGFSPDQANTQAEAEILAHYMALCDLVAQMKNSWESILPHLDRSGDESYGNQVVWMNRLLALVKEISDRLTSQLKEQGVGEIELSAHLLLPLSTMTLSELINWTQEVCDRGSLMGTRAGKDGIFALAADLTRLQEIFEDLHTWASDSHPPHPLPIPELSNNAIKNILHDLVIALDAAAERARLAERRPPVKLIDVAERFGYAGERMDLTLIFEHAPDDLAGLVVKPGSIFTQQQARRVGPNWVKVDTFIPNTASSGLKNLSIWRGSVELWEKPHGFEVLGAHSAVGTPPPAPGPVTPGTGGGTGGPPPVTHTPIKNRYAVSLGSARNGQWSLQINGVTCGPIPCIIDVKTLGDTVNRALAAAHPILQVVEVDAASDGWDFTFDTAPLNINIDPSHLIQPVSDAAIKADKGGYKVTVGSATGGQFELTIDAVEQLYFPYDASAPEIESGLTKAGHPPESVSGDGSKRKPWNIQYGTVKPKPLILMGTDGLTQGVHDARTVPLNPSQYCLSWDSPTPGVFDLCLDYGASGQSIARIQSRDAAGDVKAALAKAGAPAVVHGVGTPADPWVITFDKAPEKVDVAPV